MKAPLPANESARLEALRQHRILDTPPEASFDNLAFLAAQVCGTPIALLSLVDSDRQWFKSRLGLPLSETPRDISFCAHAILQPDLLVIPDAMADQRFATNPLVTGDPHIRFYAGVPLVTREGHALGTLCVIDRVPRDLNREERAALLGLARQALSQLELRRHLADLELSVAERKRAEESLRESENLLRTVIETEPECVKLIAADGTLISMNRAGLAMLEADSPDQLVGQCIYPLLPPPYRQAFKELTEGVFRGQPGTLQFEVVGMKGTRRWLESHAVPLRNQKDEIVACLGITRDITERKRAEDVVREWKNRYEAAVRASGHILFDCDPRTGEVIYGGNLEKILGYSVEEMAGGFKRWLDLIHPDDRVLFTQAMEGALAVKQPLHLELRVRRKDGSYIIAREDGYFVLDDAGEIARMVGFVMDISEQRLLEEHLRQAQKMEAVGRLAGGVAHDFNNLLTVILGHSELMLASGREDGGLRASAGQIKNAAERAAALTRQLLAFSRKQVLQPKVLDLNEVLAGLSGMLGRVIGEGIELILRAGPGLRSVEADRGQIEQAILNLVMNARDAMPRGGRLTIETANFEMEKGYARQPGSLAPGRYVIVGVSDTGAGMDTETQAHVFEPFFTTKEKGSGTGLGLATVYAIVKQSGGYIRVSSEPGQGTTFKIYLPGVEAVVEPSGPDRAGPPLPSETVLVVEDEESLRKLASEFLRSAGYTVLEAAHAAEAIQIGEQYQGPIHLMVTDVVMPGISGRELAGRLARLRPDTRLLYMSGYTDDAIVHHGVLGSGTPFLQKPFKLADLALKVREALEGKKGG